MSRPLHFPVGDVRQTGTLHFAGSVDAAAYQETVADAGRLASALSIVLDLTLRGAEIDCRGKVEGHWVLECCRCLARPERPFSARVEAVIPAENEVIDASEEIRQAIALAMPYRFFCKQDCKGLCPRCKKNRNLDDCACATADLSK